MNLEDFNLLEKLGNGMSKTYSLYKDIPLIGVNTTTIGIGVACKEYLQCKKDDRCVFLEKKGIWYFAILPFDSKINGYKLSHPTNGGDMLIANYKACERGLDRGYYKLLEPIYVGGIDLFELEQFDINS